MIREDIGLKPEDLCHPEYWVDMMKVEGRHGFRIPIRIVYVREAGHYPRNVNGK